ncbi:MAG: thioether cross-link-forming SCIFF peptide maturase [Tissierellia bacterium]|nr:thioether cross-link-forming SCIFF peptide maturase [Tissierellia bacterium]
MNAQIHKYYLNGNYIVMDTVSGAVHITDKIIYDIIDDIPILSKEEIKAKYKNDYKNSEIDQAIMEINELIKLGQLYKKEDTKVKYEYNSENIIKAMCLHVAHDCNLKCKYCFAAQGNFHGENLLMPLETGKKALEFLAKNSGKRRNLEVDFFGGEPTMNFPVVKELVAYGRELEKIYNKNFRFTITTNGILLDDDKIDFINEHMDNVVMSLDGRREINDEMRPTASGKGSYDIIIPKFKKLIKKRGTKDYFIRGTFTSENLDFGKDILDYYNQGFDKVSMEPVVTDEKEPYAIRKEHIEDIKAEYERFSAEYIELIEKNPNFSFFHFLIDLSQGPCAIKRSVGCGAGSEYIAVTPEGDIYPCHQFVGEKDYIIGTLDTGITNIKLREKFKHATVHDKEDCIKCWAKYYCSGGCHANAYYNNNDILKPYKIGCELEKKRIECAISILAALA